MVDLMQEVANKVGKKKYGYARSPELTTKGKMVLVQKQIMCSKKRQAPPTEALCTKTEKYGMDIDAYMEKTMTEMRQEIKRRRNEFWECKKTAETERVEWIIRLAKDRA